MPRKSSKTRNTAYPQFYYIACQTPRIDIYTEGNTRKAELLFELLEEYGTPLYEWQKTVFRRWVAEDENGRLVNIDCGLSVPRQNGKTELIVARILYGIIFRKAQGLFTAQKQKTVDVVVKRVQDFFYETQHEEIFNLLTPRFRKKPRNYSYIEFVNGARYDFITRTRLGGLGTTNDELINDEAADMTDDHQATLLPTISAAKGGNPQSIYCGTPPMASTVGTVFSRLRKQIMSSGKGAWTEWSVEGLTDSNDVEAWYKTNPSLDKSLIRDVIESEARALSIDDFNRMRLGWWSGTEDKRAIPVKKWDARYTKKPDFDDEFMPVYAVKFAPDRSAFSLAVAQPLKDGRIHTEIVMQRPMSEGFHKITGWLRERYRKCSKIIIDGATGQAILNEDLLSIGVPKRKLVAPTTTAVSEAHQFVFEGIMHGQLSHYNQPLLNQTVNVTKTRPIGRNGGFGWESMNKELSTCALDAVTFAYWGQRVYQKKTVVDASDQNQKWREILSNI